MAKKRGGRKQTIKIAPSINLLNKKNIIFVLVLALLLIMIIYFSIKAWPIMKERLGDKDNDGIKNYQDKCMSTPVGAPVDSYGCEITEEGKTHRESPIFIKKDEEAEEETGVVCSEDDGGKNIWKKGTCDDGYKQTDSCKTNFEGKLYEYECLSGNCYKHSIDCEDYNALCYKGECIDKNKDSDDDSFTDLDEYEEGTDPEDPNDYPGSTSGQSDCNSKCLSLGYIRGRGPFDSFGYCDNIEVGKYLTSSTAGDVCCCKDCNLWCQSNGWNYGTVTTNSNCDAYPTNYYDMGSSCCCHMETEPTNGDQQSDCTDSDNGNKPNVGGFVTNNNKEYKDDCIDSNKLTEYGCANNYWVHFSHICDYGCEEITTGGRILGRCKTDDASYKIAKCAMHGDAMNLNYEYKPEMNTGSECNNYAISKCGSQAVNNWQWESADKCCLWDCKENPPPAFCTDHDANYGYGATQQPSYCTDASGDKRDICEDANTIREQACSGTVCTMQRWQCPAGTSCETDSSGNGYCKDLPVTCTDYDASAGTEWDQRFTPEVCHDGIIGFINDYCVDDTHLKEAVCDISQQCIYKDIPCGMGAKCLTTGGYGHCKDMCSTIGKKIRSCINPPNACIINYQGTLLPEYDNLCPTGTHLCCV